MSGIIDSSLLERGSWQAFERAVARLLGHAGWPDVKVIGRSGDGGADIIATRADGTIHLFQCKFTGTSAVGAEAIHQVRAAGVLYGADQLHVVTSREPSRGFAQERERLRGLGLDVGWLGPRQLLRALENAPLQHAARPTPRPYQIEAIDRAREALLDTGRAQLVMATGLGKTVVMGELVEDLLTHGLVPNGRVLVLAHTVQLVDQLERSFWRHLPKTVSTHRWASAERPSALDGVTFGTIQTLLNVGEPPEFDLVLVDEAHHIGAESYDRVIAKIAPSMLLGVTATPWREDGQASIEPLLGRPVYTIGIKEGLEHGYLSEVDYRLLVDGIDWGMVRSASSHQYTIRNLNRQLILPTRDDQAVELIKTVFLDERRRRGLVFSPSKYHAQSFASDLRRAGLAAADVTSDLDHVERYKRIAHFASGRLKFLCVVDMFNEGIDIPDVDLLVFMRVTHSRRVFVQQLGRGLRLGGDKDKVVVLDFAADVRRVHAATELFGDPRGEIERLHLAHTAVNFRDISMGRFFYEWIVDLGNLQNLDEDDLVTLPVLDPHRFDYPEV